MMQLHFCCVSTFLWQCTLFWRCIVRFLHLVFGGDTIVVMRLIEVVQLFWQWFFP